MDRKKIEIMSTYLAVILLGTMTALSIIGLADAIFKWDLLPPFLDKLAVLAMSSLAILMVSSVLVSIMLNVSIIASKITEIAARTPKE